MHNPNDVCIVSLDAWIGWWVGMFTIGLATTESETVAGHLSWDRIRVKREGVLLDRIGGHIFFRLLVLM